MTDDELKECVRWIHYDLSDQELAPLLGDALRRSLGEPLVKRQGADLFAACYFKLLSGGVATLGGVRAAVDHESEAVRLLQQQVDRLKAAGIPQIQAVVAERDVSSARVVQKTGFEKLTVVEHQWLELSVEKLEIEMSHRSHESANVSWRAANQLARKRLEQLIEATFAQTLDCPALNDMRTSTEVLDGFLEGRKLRNIGRMWEVLLEGRRIIGCVLLSEHPNQLMELAYLGLSPEARGRGLGRVLVARAVERSRRRDCLALAVAVDENNWPALALYRDFGFQTHQRLGVWLLR